MDYKKGILILHIHEMKKKREIKFIQSTFDEMNCGWHILSVEV